MFKHRHARARHRRCRRVDEVRRREPFSSIKDHHHHTLVHVNLRFCAQIPTLDSITNLPAIQHISKESKKGRCVPPKRNSRVHCITLTTLEPSSSCRARSGPVRSILKSGENLVVERFGVEIELCSKSHYATFRLPNDDPNDRVGRRGGILDPF